MQAFNPGCAWNAPAYITPDMYSWLRPPQGWRVLSYKHEWLMQVLNSNHTQLYGETRYAGEGVFPFDAFYGRDLTNWYVEYLDTVGEAGTITLAYMLRPRVKFLHALGASGGHLMSMLALKGDAIKTADVHLHEFYPTPVSLVRSAVGDVADIWVGEWVGRWKYLPSRRPVRVLDLCAGNGVWGIVMKEYLEAKYNLDVELVGIEINPAIEKPPEFDQWINADFRDVDISTLGEFDFILTNPPFSLAVQVGLFAKEILEQDGKFLMLIGQNFGFAEIHGKLFDVWSPEWEDKLTKRPGFFVPFAVRYNVKIDRLINETNDPEEIKRLKKMRLGGGTNAKEYILYRWSGFDAVPHQGPWMTGRKSWSLNLEDPIRLRLMDRPVTVMAALARESAWRRNNEKTRPTFDDHWSFMACREHVWFFYNACDTVRVQLREQARAKHYLETIGILPAEEVDATAL